jgi:hypothetical protein
MLLIEVAHRYGKRMGEGDTKMGNMEGQDGVEDEGARKCEAVVQYW